MKTLYVSEENHKRLMTLKVDKGFKNADEIIDYLFAERGKV